MIDTVGMSFCLHQVLRLVLPVLESRNAQYAGRVRCRRIASERASHGPSQDLGLLRGNSLNPPDQLVSAWRRVDGVVRRRDEIRFSNTCEGSGSVVIEIQVKMTDRVDILFSSSPGTRFQGVHSHVDVVLLFVILVTEPLLEGTF